MLSPSKPETLFELFRGFVLTPEEISNRAIGEVIGSKSGDDFIKANFSRLVDQIEAKAYEVYLVSQREAWLKAIEIYALRLTSSTITRNEFVSWLANGFEDLDDFFLSLTNSRRTRAGSTFERSITTLFGRLAYPFSKQPVINGQPDFVLPSEEHFRRNPVDCIIFTAKRTVRERWRQIVTEGTRGLGFYLASIDRKVTKASLEEMGRNRIFLVVPANAKKDVSDYARSQTVLDFETFFSDYLDPAVSRWKKSHVVK